MDRQATKSLRELECVGRRAPGGCPELSTPQFLARQRILFHVMTVISSSSPPGSASVPLSNASAADCIFTCSLISPLSRSPASSSTSSRVLEHAWEMWGGSRGVRHLTYAFRQMPGIAARITAFGSDRSGDRHRLC